MSNIDVIENKYSKLIKKYIFYGVCNDCKCSIQLESDKPILIDHVYCKNCNKEKEVDNKEKFVYSNSRYKLQRIWKGLKTSNKLSDTWKDDFERFRDWSINNEYKPWKQLFIYDENSLYSPDNCYWALDGKEGSYKIECFKIDDTIKNIKFIGNKLKTLRTEVCDIQSSMAGISEYNQYIVKGLKEFEKKSEKIDKLLKDMEKIIEEINLDDLGV